MSKPNIHQVPVQGRPLTEEEKRIKVMQFLQQKRETFAVNILCNMVQSEIDNLISNSSAPSAIVKMAVKMADELINELYPMPEEDKANK